MGIECERSAWKFKKYIENITHSNNWCFNSNLIAFRKLQISSLLFLVVMKSMITDPLGIHTQSVIN